MESAKRIINEDNALIIRRVNCLDLYLKNGITLFVDEFGTKYHDMTLIQYAIAKRKPETLKYMLEATYNQCKIPLEKIISPETSSTIDNLLNLAVEFGSINEEYGKDYKERDNKCLEAIIEFMQQIKNNDNDDKELNLDIENIDGETPLIRAIHHQNIEACQLLIQKGADIFHESTKNKSLDNPLFYLLKNAKYYDMIDNSLDLIKKKALGEDKYCKVIEFCRQIYDKKILCDISDQAEKFLHDLFKKNPKPKPEAKHEEPKPESDQDDDQYCSCCNKKISFNDTKECDKCEKEFCQRCYPKHSPCFDE